MIFEIVTSLVELHQIQWYEFAVDNEIWKYTKSRLFAFISYLVGTCESVYVAVLVIFRRFLRAPEETCATNSYIGTHPSNTCPVSDIVAVTRNSAR